MNTLNSVLIEGVVSGEPKASVADGGVAICTFQLQAERCARVEDVVDTDVSRYTIRTSGRLADACIKSIGSGTGVRVIGRLHEDKELGVIIVADHIEWKPAVKPGQDDGGGYS